MNMATLQKDTKLWNVNVIVITKGQTEKEAESNVRKGIIFADDILDVKEEHLSHIDNEEHRKRLTKDIFRSLQKMERALRR